MKKSLILLLAVFLVVLVGCGGNQPVEEELNGGPENDAGNGEGFVEEDDKGEAETEGEDFDVPTIISQSCTGCHGDTQIYQTRAKDRWPGIIRDMASRAGLEENKTEAIILYMQENYSL